MTRVMMSEPYELMVDLKLFGKLSHFKIPLRTREWEATWQLHSKEERKISFLFFLNCPEITYFSFHVMLKWLLSFWCFWHFLSNSDILISISHPSFFFFFSSDWNLWLIMAFSAGCTWRVAHTSKLKDVLWNYRCLQEQRWPWGNVESWQRGQEMLRATFFWVFASCRCYYHFHLEEQIKELHRWSKVLETWQQERGRTEIYWGKKNLCLFTGGVRIAWVIINEKHTYKAVSLWEVYLTRLLFVASV